MIKVVIEDNIYQVTIPDSVIENGDSFFNKIDQDMDKGWQMGRDWVNHPDNTQRCQIVADRLADAIETENETLSQLAAGYIINRMPGVREVHIDTEGEMQETRFISG